MSFSCQAGSLVGTDEGGPHDSNAHTLDGQVCTVVVSDNFGVYKPGRARVPATVASY